MKVLMLLEGEFPYDERVEKEALSLKGAGYEVDIFALSFSQRKDVDTYKGIKVFSPFVSKLLFKFYPALLVFPVYKWARRKQIIRLTGSERYDVIHVHDLPMSSLGYWLKERYHAKLVCDQHELYSEWIGRTAHMNTMAGRLIMFFSNWKKYEQKYLSRADLIITVSENLRELYIRLHNIEGEKIISVPNTPLKRDIQVQPADLGLKEKYKGRFVLFYGGMIDILRGIDLAIKAIPLIRKEIPNVVVVLAGRIRKGCDPVGLAKDLGVEDHVEYVGFLNPQELRAYMDASTICFATLPADSLEINNTIITKIYQYALAHKPILTGQALMMKDFVTQYNLGMAANEKDPENLAKTIFEMKAKLSSFTFNIPEYILFWDYTSEILLKKYLFLKY